MDHEKESAGDPIPPNCVVIEVRVAELKQLFNAIDPSPFRERDLDPKAEEFIVGGAREARRDAVFALLVHLDRPAGLPEEAAALKAAVEEFFTQRSQVTMRRLHQLFRNGRTSLLIGTAFLTAAVGVGNLIATAMNGHQLGDLLREGVLIGGWVAMWRPLEIFLYGWWPLLAEARLFRRLAAMPVRIAYSEAADDPHAWRRDWPATPVR